MDAEREHWFEALAIEHRYGAKALAFVADQIGRLTRRGDRAAAERLRLIEQKLVRLRKRQA